MVTTVKTFAARRPLQIGDSLREPPNNGEPITAAHLVPEAHLWFRLDSYLHTGYIVEHEVSIEELFASFELHGVSDTDGLAILDALGLSHEVDLSGIHKTPRKEGPPKKRPAAKAVAPQRKSGAGTLRQRSKPVEAESAPLKRSKAPAPPVKGTAKKTTTTRRSGRANTAVRIPQTELAE